MRRFGVHSQPTAALKEFGRSDCFLLLSICSAGPHSFLVNIQNVSKGRTLHWNVALKHSCACCTKLFPQILGKRLGLMANSLQPSKTLDVLIASCSCTYGHLVPIHFLKILRIFLRGAHCIEILHSNMNAQQHVPPFDRNTWDAWSSHCKAQKFWLF